MDANETLRVDISAVSEMEVIYKIRFSKWHKGTRSLELSSSFFKNDEVDIAFDELLRMNLGKRTVCH